MTDLFDEKGNLVENVYTEEDVDNKVTEKIEEEKTKITEDIEEKHTEELDTLKDELEEKKQEVETAKEELEKAGDKDVNFKKLREAKDKKSEEFESLKTEFEEHKAGTDEKITKIRTDQINDIKTEALNTLAKDDKELKEKIEFHYKAFSGTPETKEQVLERIKNAHTLATGGVKEESGLPSSALSSEGGAAPNIPGSEKTTKLNQEEKDFLKQMNITDKDLKEQNLL